MKNYKNLKIFQIIILVFFTSAISTLLVEEVYADERREVLTLVNNERISRSLEPLQLDDDLRKAAQIRSEEITIFLSHERPDGSQFSSVSPKAKAENVAAGHKTPEEVVYSWMKSPSHRNEILNPTFTTIGIGYTKTNKEYKHYWVKLFGRDKVKKIHLERVSNLKAESKKNQVTLRWKKQKTSQATGFEIFKYNPKSKNYGLLVRIPKPNTNSFVINRLKPSTSYRYQIRSYKVVDKKTYYTSLLKISAKTKAR